MKIKMLKLLQIKSLLPAILKEWKEQEYPTILAGIARLQMDKKRSQELAFSIVENAASNWLEMYLRNNHSAVASDLDREIVKKELIKAVYEQYCFLKGCRMMRQL
jgi:hypothetical protein